MNKTTVAEVYKEQILIECRKKGLENFILYFMTKYPYYSLEKLPIDKILEEHLSFYDISFLASYVRYSDMNLLKSGMRDEIVREKLCFLHLYIGTISSSFRKFIWENSITKQDIIRWLPLLSIYHLKERILKCSNFDENFRILINDCLKEESYVLKNLELLEKLFPEIDFEIADLPRLEEQKSFYEFLKVYEQSYENISFHILLSKFSNIKILLKNIASEETETIVSFIREYLRDSSFHMIINSMEDIQKFRKEKENAHHEYLEKENDLSKLKEFLSRLFLGMSYEDFVFSFRYIPESNEKEYLLLSEFFHTSFPLVLKENLYFEFMKIRDLREYIKYHCQYLKKMKELSFQKEIVNIDSNQELQVLQGSSFTFLTMNIHDYQEGCIKRQENLVRAEVKTERVFNYLSDGGILAFSDASIVSYQEEDYCLIKGKNLRPSCVLAFDNVRFLDITIRKVFGIPIVLIETERYVQIGIEKLHEYFEKRDWVNYLKQKSDLATSISNHPWLFHRYFSDKELYNDVKDWIEDIEKWMIENKSTIFLKKQLEILKMLIGNNEQIASKKIKIDIRNQEMASKYKKLMLQYQKLI